MRVPGLPTNARFPSGSPTAVKGHPGRPLPTRGVPGQSMNVNCRSRVALERIPPQSAGKAQSRLLPSGWPSRQRSHRLPKIGAGPPTLPIVVPAWWPLPVVHPRPQVSVRGPPPA